MSDELRRRREVLRAELRAIERELGDARAGPLDPELLEELANAPEFVTLIDDEGRVIPNNRRQPGVPEVVGRHVFDFIAQAYHPHLQEIIERAHRLGHPCPGRIDTRRPEGAAGRAYHLWAAPLPAPVAGATTVLIGFDATHLQLVERALQDERSAVYSLVGGVPDTILIVDREHRVTFANHVVRMKKEDVLGADVTNLVPETSRELVRRAVDSVFQGGPSTSYETHIDVPDGRYWYHIRVGPIRRDGAVVRVCMVATDITELRQRELQLQKEREALQQSEARFRTLVEHAPEALVILDPDSGRFVDASDRACELFGATRSQITKRGPLDFSPRHQPDGRTSEDAAREHIAHAVRTGSAQFEWVHSNNAGREFVCEVNLVALPHGPRQLFRGSVMDISERKQAERERAQLQEELFQAQKMQAIGQLTGGVAHDFNNLLTVILSHVELLALDAPSDPAVSDHATQIMGAAARAASLTQQLLAFARRQPLNPQRIDLAQLVAQMKRLLARTLGETITVETACAPSLWPCVADRTQLENALLNLAINARDAMPTGGKLTISMENRDVETSGRHTDVPPGRYVVICVADNGLGMSPQVAARAFEPFYTTKEVGHGSGMGLSMVYGFVNQSGGHVALDSAPGEGTRVTLYLAAVDGPVTEPAPPAGGPQDRGQGELILVVEDEPAVRTTLVLTLQHLGYRTVDAPDATTALHRLAETQDIALVLTDVVLAGGISGVQLARQIAESHPHIPVTFVSGYARDVVARDGELPEDVQLLQKPFTHQQLGAAVRAAIGRSAR